MIEHLYSIYQQHPTVCTDTRNIIEGSIFFALKGANFNGNAFAAEAIKKGSKYAVIDEKAYESEHTVLVDDVLTALQQLAVHHRKQLNIPIIGITGSNGKTTTKELINAVLSEKFNCFATRGNFNNHIGVPLSLLAIDDEVEIAVIEMGANHPGEIGDLSAISQPSHGIITNIGKAHIEGFGSFEGVIKTKKELYDFAKANNRPIFINANNNLLCRIGEGIEQITYGDGVNNYCVGTFTGSKPFASLKWSCNGFDSDEVTSNLIGHYNYENILAAICIGNHFGVSPNGINHAITNYQPDNNRSQLEKTTHNTLIMDAYNANPTSMKAAIENFNAMDYANKFFILGDMLELGDESIEEHRAIMQLLAKHQLTNGILVGAEFNKCANHTNLPVCTSASEAMELLHQKALRDHLVLIKGSRGIRLETVVESL